MPLSIHPIGAIGTPSQPANLKAAALDQATPPGSVATTATIQRAPSAADSPALSDAMKALGLTSKLASDLQAVASALVPSMEQIVENRPDLATASFDFQSDNGAIKVVSDSLSDGDKAWLEQTLNANQGLVDAVQAFHNDATTSYALWAGADGQSPLDTASISDLADGHFSFMSMFNKSSQAMLQNMDQNGSYTTPDGAPMDFHRSVNSALNFLIYQKSNQAVLDGSSTYTTHTGQTFHGAIKGNFFSIPGVIPDFLPSTSSSSFGLNAMA
ncbi:MAG TPA: hypothetical protein VIM98_18405 [Dyella sp.]|uniref:hypothetical protein n=1 Tax=Dyella sp. TaxID=1869338 RepID=UPI002F95835F